MRQGADMSDVNPSEGAKDEELGQWTLAPVSEAPEPSPPPPAPTDANDGAFAAPGGPVSEETEDWALPPAKDGDASLGVGFRPVPLDGPPPAPPLPGVALDPSVEGTAAGAVAPSRYDMNMLMPDAPSGPPEARQAAPLSPPTAPPAEVGG